VYQRISGPWCMRLHASTVKLGDRIVIFTGDSGVGKTTLYNLLSKKGFVPLGDELAVVVLDNDGCWKLHRAGTTVDDGLHFKILDSLEKIDLLIFPEKHLQEGYAFRPCPPIKAAQILFHTGFPRVDDFKTGIVDVFRAGCSLARNVRSFSLDFALNTDFLPELLEKAEETRVK